MKNIYTKIGILALTLGSVGLLASTANAFQGDPNVKGPNYTPERHEDMTKAFSSNDYNSWKNLMSGRGRVSQVVNQENFSKFAEAHKLALAGDLEGAKKIRQEIGLGLQNGSGKSMQKSWTSQGMGARWNR